MKNLGIIVLTAAMALSGASACKDAATQKEVADLKARVEKLEKGGGAPGSAGNLEKRVAKMEGFLLPIMKQQKGPPEPDPKAVYAVSVEGNPSEGPADAPITIVKGFEYACPYCYRVNPTLEQLKKDYPGKIRVVYKQFLVHPDRALTPALAACAADRQGKYTEMEHLIWEKGFKENALDEAKMVALATEAKLNLDKFKADMAGDACKQRIAKDQEELQKFGMNGTPAFWINGRFLGGAQPLPNFKRLVDEELKKAEEKIAGGVKAGDYYAKVVMEGGLKEFVPPPDEEE